MGGRILFGRFPGKSLAVVMAAGDWVSCRSQQLGKPGPQPVRSIDFIEQSSGNILDGAAGASGAAWHGTLPQRAGTPLLRLYCLGFSQSGLLPEEGREEQVHVPGACPSWGWCLLSSVQHQLLLQVLS